MMIRKLIAGVFAFGMMLGSAAAQGAPKSTLDVVKERGTLIAGLRKDIPPLAYLDSQGNWVGFEIELAQLIADKLGVKLERVEAGSRTRIPLLVNGNIDFVMNGMLATAERAEVIDFSLPYIFYGQKIMVKKGSGITGPERLAGKTVGVTQGGKDFDLLKALQPEAKPAYFQEWPQVVLAVKGGKIDALSTTDFILSEWAKEHEDLKIVGESFGRFGMSIGVRHNDSKWRLAIDRILGEAWSDGSYSKSYKKYFGTEPEFDLPVWSDYSIRG